MPIKPMLAMDSPKAFDSSDYIWEHKYDGVRMLAKTSDAGYELQARSGSNKTSLFRELKLQTAVPAIIDGEIVSTNGKFNDIQHRVNRERGLEVATANYPVVYAVFDVLEVTHAGVRTELREQPLWKRKEILAKLIIPSDNVILAPFTEKGVELFQHAVEAEEEGVIGKHKQGHYLEGKRSWLKVKTWVTDTFIVVGFTQGTGWREKLFGSLVLADMNGKYVGAVGTGFTDEVIQEIMVKLAIPGPCPWPKEPEPAKWIKPWAAKIRYLEFTNDGILRFPSYKGAA